MYKVNSFNSTNFKYVIGIYRSKTKVTICKLIDALTHLKSQLGINRTNNSTTLLLGNFKYIVLQKKNAEQKALTKYPILQTKGTLS